MCFCTFIEKLYVVDTLPIFLFYIMNTDQTAIVAATIGIVLVSRIRRRRLATRKRIWVKDWIRNREHCGFVNNLLQELRLGDAILYKNFLRMSASDFEYLLEKVTPLIKRQDTHMRQAITPSERLSLTLRYLATGDSYKSLMYLFRIPANTISTIIPEVCQAIYDVLKDEYLKIPQTEEEWVNVSNDFDAQWNFPNCLGAMDGKHVNIKAQANSGSLYFNYKHTHSIILMALADANYKFIYINVGAPGRESDGGVYLNCSVSQALENNTLNIPQPKPLPGRKNPTPYVVVADDAFALKSYIMKPFAMKNLSVPERIFNYRLSRARRIIENVFGIASARFRVLRNTCELSPEKVKKIVCAVCVLHNYLMSRKLSTVIYAPRGTFDIENNDGSVTFGTWRNESTALELLSRNNVHKNPTTSAKNIREEFKEYFCREGEVYWQHNYI